MATDNYTVAVVTTALDDTATERTETVTADEECTETFWAEVQLEASAADVALLLNLLTDPLILVVIGGKGVSFKLDSTGTDDIGADPVAVVANEDAGLGIDQILLSNSDSVAHAVQVMAFE